MLNCYNIYDLRTETLWLLQLHFCKSLVIPSNLISSWVLKCFLEGMLTKILLSTRIMYNVYKQTKNSCLWLIHLSILADLKIFCYLLNSLRKLSKYLITEQDSCLPIKGHTIYVKLYYTHSTNFFAFIMFYWMLFSVIYLVYSLSIRLVHFQILFCAKQKGKKQ